MNIDDIKKKYEKYGFSDFERINKEFELGAIELDKWDFLNSFCRISNARIGKFIGYVTPLFMPGGTYAAIVQGGVKNKVVIDDAKKLYKDLMILYHDCLKAELAEEKEQIIYLKNFLKKYPSLKERVDSILDACALVFIEQDYDKKSDAKGYLG